MWAQPVVDSREATQGIANSLAAERPSGAGSLLLRQGSSPAWSLWYLINTERALQSSSDVTNSPSTAGHRARELQASFVSALGELLVCVFILFPLLGFHAEVLGQSCGLCCCVI